MAALARGRQPLQAGTVPAGDTSKGVAPADSRSPLQIVLLLASDLPVCGCPHLSQPGHPLQGALVAVGRLYRGLTIAGRPCKQTTCR
ncbi:hypothetical protein BHM03_00013593 [Ensete ventricosum]|uniref:Uncharacterized protein n=1 Tax=Ensete ventricosum TaxID=4639 RepID=A0A445ME24_ENSVE|nr:hypothetical protein BHM03_00013593 [Ensete ventricosum]